MQDVITTKSDKVLLKLKILCQ